MRRLGRLLGAVGCALMLFLPSATVAQPTVDFLITNRLAEPYSVAVDDENRIYITDSADHRILRYDSDNGSLTSIAGIAGTPGTTNGPGFVARFFSPRGVVMARGGLVVADSGNHQLRFLTLTGSVSIVSSFAGSAGTPGYVDGPVGSARFNSPSGLAADETGNIYVADSKNNAIRKIDINGIVSTVATNFAEPAAVTVGGSGELFVADTRNHSIKVIEPSGNVVMLAGGGATSSGTNDSFFAEEALFSSPSGLIWLGPATGLIVSDTGNHTLRRIFYDPVIAAFFPGMSGYSVETYAGIPRQPGFEDGALARAKFSSPIGVARDQENGLIVADLGNRALRRIQTTPRLPRIATPKIGYVVFVIDDITGAEVSRLVPFTDAIFNNDPTIAILAEQQTETFFTSGPTPGLFDADTIPIPNANNSQPAPPYSDGLLRSQVRPSLLDARPDVTIKAISSAEGRRPSEVAQARIQFKTATPVIVGDNPASFALQNDTAGAEMWYTLDGSVPTNQPPSIQAGNETISLLITNAVTFRARAFRRNYKPSEVATKTFFPNDFQANRISFGFSAGEASSQFRGSAGQRFIAPVTLSLLPSQKMYSLQFNLSVTNRSGPAVVPGAYGFNSMLLELLNDGSFRRIDPKAFERNEIEVLTNVVPNGILITTNYIEIFRDMIFTNASQNLIGVGWFEVVGKTNLYNTVGQDLITYSHAHDKRFLSANGRVVVGGYSFQIPALASSGSTYRIQVDRPSAIDSISSRDIFIDTPKDGSLGAGAINAIKDVSVVPGGLNPGELHYIVGDVAPFRWYNAGDFGDTNVLSSDVFQVFQAATYGFNVPPAGTDFFDAMDACCGSANGAVLTDLFDGNQADINVITSGDGILDVTDVFVIFRRALDPSLKWFARFWSNGTRQAAEVPNLYRGKRNERNPGGITLMAKLAADELSSGSAGGEPPSATFVVEDVAAEPGVEVAVPVRAEIAGDYPARVLMLSVTVEPLDDAAPLSDPIRVVTTPLLGAATFASSATPSNYSAAWLDHRIAGLKGNVELATVHVKIPTQDATSSRYRVRIDHASASPNGIARFPSKRVHGLVAAELPTASIGGIPESWRLRYFGSIYNQLGHDRADADGDGTENWAEYRAGTDPTDLHSSFRLKTAGARGGGKRMAIRWPSARNRQYVIEACDQLAPSGWAQISPPIAGTGGHMEFDVSEFVPAVQFFRVRLAE